MRHMTVPVPYVYAELFVPPRCRKPRERDAHGVYDLQLRVVDEKEAPVAFRHKAHMQYSDAKRYYNMVREYRMYDGELYVRESKLYAMQKGWLTVDELVKHIKVSHARSRMRDRLHYAKELNTPAECEEYLREEYASFLIIEVNGRKQVWGKSGEPMYEIGTFGLGHNHAGIGVDVFIQTYYNPNISNTRYFTALQREACIQEALRIAEARGDTNSFRFIKKSPVIEVVLPDMVRRTPAVDHGNGDPFMNGIEKMIEGTSTVGEAGLLATAMTFASLGA